MMRKFLTLLMLLVLVANTAGATFIFADPDEDDTTPDVEASIQIGSGEASAMPEGETQGTPDEGVEILITAAGDVTLGGNMRKNPSSNMYTKIVEAQEGNLAYFFANVYEYFAQDDMTLVNFEGTLTTATDHKDNTFCFRAPPEHVQVLTLSSIEAVAFENNHVMDFKQKGYDDTIAAFEQNGIVYSTEAHMGVFETKGVSIAMLAYQLFDNQYPRITEKMPQDIAAARAAGHDIVIVSYHWGVEEDFKPHDRQVALGRATIDAGADLVLGHHSHRINPIEEYNGKYIVYSLANSSFSGNTKPNNMDTFLFQQKFLVKDGEVSNGGFRIIPCSISSNSGLSGAVSDQNDMAVTPFEPGGKGAERVINRMIQEGESLEYGLKHYPTEWE